MSIIITDKDYDKIESALDLEIKRDEGYSFHGDSIGLTIIHLGDIEVDYFLSIQQLETILNS